jgi:hypothetical protein
MEPPDDAGRYSGLFVGLQLGGDCVEGRREVVTHGGHNTDRCNGNESGNQAVFNGRRASLVFQKSGQGHAHLRAP